jgi:hypothetical protein
MDSLRRVLLVFVLLALVALATHAHAQNAGNVGIYTREVPVFTAQSTTLSSKIFPDFGFACNFLSYQTTNFTGVITVEWAPPGTSTYITLTEASFPLGATDTGNHVLSVGGYFPNMRSTVTPSAGSLNAEYTASSAPCPFVATGLGSNGPTPPIVCDRNAIQVVASGSAPVSIASLGPILAGDTIVICGLTISTNGTTSAGTFGILWANSAANCTTAIASTWGEYVTANTPQLFTVLVPQRAYFPQSTPYPCFQNSSGASAEISISYASVHGI